MANFYYECPKCGHKYHENRDITESQFFTHCYVCKDVEYVQVDQ